MNGKAMTYAALAVIVLMIGCAKSQPTLDEPAASAEAQQAAAAGQNGRIGELRTKVSQFAADVRALPARSDPENRAQLGKAFAELGEILPLLRGPNPDGGFRQQLSILQDASEQLSSGSAELSAEPTIGSGLRAAARALETIRAREFADVENIEQTLERLRSKLAELDSVRGPIHRLVAAKSMNEIAQALGQMTAELEQRAAPAAEQPAAATTAPAQ